MVSPYPALPLGDDVAHFIHSKVLHDVAVSGYSLRFVPPSLLTVPICEAAVQQYACALEHVPPHFQSMSMCMSAARRSKCARAFIADADVQRRVDDALRLEAPLPCARPRPSQSSTAHHGLVYRARRALGLTL